MYVITQWHVVTAGLCSDFLIDVQFTEYNAQRFSVEFLRVLTTQFIGHHHSQKKMENIYITIEKSPFAIKCRIICIFQCIPKTVLRFNKDTRVTAFKKKKNFLK